LSVLTCLGKTDDVQACQIYLWGLLILFALMHMFQKSWLSSKRKILAH